MKKKFNNLNEQVLRMKSLFNDERLYGNIENDEKIITEQYKLFSNIADAFKVSLKSFNQLDTFTKFLNREINNVDDIIKHVDDFEDMWKIIDKNLNTVLLKSNLIKLKKVIELDRLKNMSQEDLKIFLKGIPVQGGMQDIIYDIWAKSKGLSTNLPQKVDNRVVKLDPKTKEIVIGTSNKGVIAYKNKEGKVTVVEKDPNYKPDEDTFDTKGGEDTTKKEDFEDVDYEEIIDVKEGTPFDSLDGKKVSLDEELIDSLDDKIKKGTESGNFVKFSIIGEGEEGIKAAKEMMDTITKGKSESAYFTPNNPAETMIDNSTASEEVKNQLKKSGLLKKLFTEYPTKYVLNPSTYLPKEEFLKDANSRWNRRGWQVLFRVVLDFALYEYLTTPDDSTFIRHATSDLYKLSDYVLKTSNIENTPAEFVKGICDGIEDTTKSKQFCFKLKQTLKNKINTNFKSKIEDENICSDLLKNNNDVIIKQLFDKTTEEAKSEIIKSFENKLKSSKLFSLESEIEKVSNFFLTNDTENEEINNLKLQMLTELEKKRISCIAEEAKEKALKEQGLKEVEVTVVPSDIEQGIKKELDLGGEGNSSSGEENSSGGEVKVNKNF
jgi:hypothetical protein